MARDIDHVVAGDFGENPDVPDDTISDGKSLVEHVTKRAEEGKEPLPYTELLLEDLGNTLARAEAEWNEAEQAQAEYRAIRLTVRELGTALEQDLVAFSQALRTVIGSAHPDYQKLRLEKIRTPDADSSITTYRNTQPPSRLWTSGSPREGFFNYPPRSSHLRPHPHFPHARRDLGSPLRPRRSKSRDRPGVHRGVRAGETLGPSHGLGLSVFPAPSSVGHEATTSGSHPFLRRTVAANRI